MKASNGKEIRANPANPWFKNAMYFVKRILGMIPLLLLITFLAFLLMHLAPGGPFDRERSSLAAGIEERIKEKYHLDRSWVVQYGFYLRDLLHGDFGPSLKYRNHTVNDIIAQGLPVSLTLGSLAFLFALGVGIPLGLWTAVHKGKWQDLAGSLLSLLAVCIPALVLGPLLVLFLAVRWRLFPVGLWESPWHAVLPVVALGLYFSGKISRLMREGMASALTSEFILTARAKGLSQPAILWRHAMRQAVVPVVSYSGPLLADLLTGSFVVENLFQIPGIGVFVVNSFNNRDYPMIMGLVILYATLLLILNLIVDWVYRWLDPRLRSEPAA